ncbi:MAG: alternative ribosome rescue aminoacyl-tRNA hydrolase ArfB [Bacteroidota bacterium]
MPNKNQIKDFKDELSITASKSSGPGGQNVNKVNTKVEVRLNVEDSILLSDEEKVLVHEKLSNKINKSGELVVVSQSERTQLKNKEKAIEKLNLLIANALKVEKERKKSKIPKSVKEKRLKDKKLKSDKKDKRKPPEL